MTPGTNTVESMDRDPFLGVSVKVNLNSEIDRFGLIVKVGGSLLTAPGLKRLRVHLLISTTTRLIIAFTADWVRKYNFRDFSWYKSDVPYNVLFIVAFSVQAWIALTALKGGQINHLRCSPNPKPCRCGDPRPHASRMCAPCSCPVFPQHVPEFPAKSRSLTSTQQFDQYPHPAGAGAGRPVRRHAQPRRAAQLPVLR